MAWFTKYTITFKDLEEITNTIYLQYDGWGGGITALTPGKTPAILRYNTSDRFNTIVSSSLDFQVVYESAIDGLFTEADRTVRVYYERGTTTYWYGYLVPYQYYRLLSGRPHYATFTATDQLQLLRDIPFEDGSGDPYFYLSTDLAVLSNVLAKSGLALPTKDGINIYDDDMDKTDADSPLDQVYSYPEMYWNADTDERGDCATVLHDILKKYGARVFQDNQLWYLQRPNTMWSKHAVRTFSAANPMSYLSNTVDYVQWNRQDETGYWLADPEIELKPRAGKVVLTTAPRMRTNLNLNPDFQTFTLEGANDPYYWSGDVGIEFAAASDYISLGENDSADPPELSVWVDFYAEQVKKLSISIEFKATYSGGTNCTLYFMLSNVDEDLWYNWSTPGWVDAQAAYYTVDVPSDVGASMSDYATLTFTADNVLVQSEINQYRFHVFEVWNNNDTTCNLLIRKINISPAYVDDVPVTEIITKENDVTSYNVIEDELVHCDTFADMNGPLGDYTGYDDKYYVLRDGTAANDTTDAWYIKGDPISEATNVSIQNLLTQQYLDGYWEPREVIRGKLRGDYRYFQALVDDDITDSYGFPKVFIPLDQACDIHRMEWSGTWEEVAPVYDDSTLEWADHDFGGAGSIDGNELTITEFTITGAGEEGRFAVTHTAAIGEMIRMVIVLTAQAGGSYVPTMTMDGDAITVAWGTNYIEYYCDSATTKELVITADLGEELNLVCTVDLYYITGI